jgi:hypothetical protein
MRILVASDYIRSDPQRHTFYNSDLQNTYSLIPLPRRSAGPAGRLIRLGNLLLVIVRIIIMAVKDRPAVIFSENPRDGIVLACLLRAAGMNGVPHVIWNFNMRKSYSGLRLALARYACRGEVTPVVYSAHEKSQYSKLLCIPPNRLRLKYLSGPYLEDPRYAQLPKDTPKAPYVVCPGYSGRDFELMAEVARHMAHVSFFVLAYPRFVGAIEFPDNVRIVYGISEVDYCAFIAGATVCFLPIANTETANGQIAIVQAMSMKTLLVTNPTPGTTDYLLPGVNCIDFATGSNSDSVADVLTDAMAHVRAYAYLVDNAYQFAREHFSTVGDAEVVTAARVADRT